jgi:recombination protein RecR
MKYYPDSVEKLIEKIIKLPGIGPKSAERIVNYILEESEENILALSENLALLKKEVHLCKRCFNLSDSELCGICSDEKRESAILCIVEEVKDLVVLERSGFKGIYHVLGGRISALGRISPEDLKIVQLEKRLESEDIREVIIATNPTPEGEYTAAYISGILKHKGVKHSRLACGIPVGAEIEYVDINTLRKSIEGRKEL